MIDIEPGHLEIVRRTLKNVAPGFEVRVFGSRLNGKARKFSDLDLALYSASPVPPRLVESLKDAFAHSDLPFQVDVLDWNGVSESFRKVMAARFEVIQAGE